MNFFLNFLKISFVSNSNNFFNLHVTDHNSTWYLSFVSIVTISESVEGSHGNVGQIVQSWRIVCPGDFKLLKCSLLSASELHRSGSVVIQSFCCRVLCVALRCWRGYGVTLSTSISVSWQSLLKEVAFSIANSFIRMLCWHKAGHFRLQDLPFFAFSP